jgi:hemerythrin-like domain-containing protein
VCGHCGCGGVDSIGELRQEHESLQDEAGGIRHALDHGDLGDALVRLKVLVAHLVAHVEREERGLFAALRAQGDFVAEVEALEAEHLAFDAAATAIDPAQDGFSARITALLADLDQHIEREDLGIFPVSVVTLGSSGWATVERAHLDHPSFLAGRNPT